MDYYHCNIEGDNPLLNPKIMEIFNVLKNVSTNIHSHFFYSGVRSSVFEHIEIVIKYAEQLCI